ncbi:hypothetical protein D3C76_1117440 [compost metagenome]
MVGVGTHQVLILDADAVLDCEQCIGSTVGINHCAGAAANNHRLRQGVDKIRAQFNLTAQLLQALAKLQAALQVRSDSVQQWQVFFPAECLGLVEQPE